MAKFKMTKFHDSDSGIIKIHYETLPSGKTIAFGIAGTDLSTMQFGDGNFDFDKESDDIIRKHETSDTNRAFEYVPNLGFDEVKTDKQNWFVFK